MEMTKKFVSVLLSLMLVLGAVAVGGMSVSADNILPDVDVTYTSGNDWEGTLVIDESKTVKISGITHENIGSNGSPIKICGNSTVNLVFEGNNVLSGSQDSVSAGIEVEEGSTVNIYAKDGASLTVTGGKYGAGIGGIGYNSVSPSNPSAGNIIINGGRITAKGGLDGAGIGSGYHSSASDIKISGGDVTALGGNGGAGIGTGYASSGGASLGAGIGFFNGGNITIDGGRVRAAGCPIDFDVFDVFDSETYYSGDYSDSFSAGIGGGYGASSGNIVIEGNADVTAFGVCGGAGIGTGRGTSKVKNFDSENFDCNVIIRGNAKVAAAAGDDLRQSVKGDDGGAAIGLGRGCTLEGEPKGSVVIEDNAQVTAVASDHAAAIGGSSVVGSYSQIEEGVISRPMLADLKTLSIGSGCTVTAVTDGYSDPIRPSDNLTGIIEINANAEFKEKYPAVFAEASDPVVFKAYDRDTGEALSPEIKYVVNTKPVAETFEFVIPQSSGTVYFSNGEYCLGNDIEEAPADFVRYSGRNEFYNLTCLCYTATFVMSEDNEISVCYPAGAAALTEPAVPEKDYYTSAWEEYELNGNITVNAVYTPVEYEAEFTADGKTVDTVSYTVETESIEEPGIPAKENYTAKWKDYALTPGGITVEAEYTAIEYKAAFVGENGETVTEIPYTVETESITEPAVPAKEGYTGKWEDYKLTPGGITVKPVYTEIPADEPSGKPADDAGNISSLGYKENRTFTADTGDLPEGAEVHWFVNGEDVGTGSEYTIVGPKDDYTIQAKVIDKDGNVIYEGEEQTVEVKNGFLDKVMFFFAYLLKILLYPYFMLGIL